jgi:CheY-like chemotaxis protein
MSLVTHGRKALEAMTTDQILIVEDNTTQGLLFEKLATKAGVQAHVVKDGREAIEAVIANPHYVAVFMDLALIKMSGLECTKRIRDLELGTVKHLPIIAITALEAEDARDECINAGMDDYLAKPFSADQFSAMLQKWRLPAAVE